MSEIRIHSEPIKIINDLTGETLLEAPLFDLFYLIGQVMVETNSLPLAQRYLTLANTFREFYGVELPWSACLAIHRKVEEMVASLKKTDELWSETAAMDSTSNESSPNSVDEISSPPATLPV